MQDKSVDMSLLCNADGSPVSQNISLYDLKWLLAIGSILPIKNWMVKASIEWEMELAYMEKINPNGKQFEDSWG